MNSSDPIIALVDDDKVFQLIASRNIKATHFPGRLLQFTNGGEAIQYLKDNASDEDALPDMLLLDINMPIVDGWMFMQDYIDLKPTIHKAIKIYMVSSSLDPRDIDRARAISDIEDYVTKPISQQKFAELVSSITEV